MSFARIDMRHVLSVVGARPQFVKLAPMSTAFERAGVAHTVIHTGQHYDTRMSDTFFDDLDLATPVANLGIGSGSHGLQTGRMLEALEIEIRDRKPDCVLVYGDTNSTLAGALAATKLEVFVAHLEAGLRSFDRRMPEEINRVLTDHASDLCLAPTAGALRQLQIEGLAGNAVLVGDVMVDVCLRVRDEVRARPRRLPFDPHAGDYVIGTLHRPSNVDSKERLSRILGALTHVPARVILAAHPRLVDAAARHGLLLARENIEVVEPLAYSQMVCAVLQSKGVVTDSGGLQKEAFLLERPCTTIRAETEWVETLVDNWNVLDYECTRLAELVVRPTPVGSRLAPFGLGDAADRSVAALGASVSVR